MTTQNTNSELLTKVVQRIDGQGFLPLSPGFVTGDKSSFCAGAAFIYEAAQERMPADDSKAFARELLTNGTEGLRTKARELNLDLHLVNSLISMNDSFSDEDRAAKMREAIQTLSQRVVA